MVHDHVAGFPVHQWRLAGDGLLADAAALVRSLRAEEVPRDLLHNYFRDHLVEARNWACQWPSVFTSWPVRPAINADY